MTFSNISQTQRSKPGTIIFLPAYRTSTKCSKNIAWGNSGTSSYFFGLLVIKKWMDSSSLPQQGNGKKFHYNKASMMWRTCTKKLQTDALSALLHKRLDAWCDFSQSETALYTDETLVAEAAWERMTACFFPTEAASSNDDWSVRENDNLVFPLQRLWVVMTEGHSP